MLKITVAYEVEDVLLKLEGDLTGTWVRDLEEAWRRAREAFAGKSACIDLSDVAHVDDAGRYLLALIQETGARMVSTGVATKELLESIAREWPAARPGLAGSAGSREPRPARA